MHPVHQPGRAPDVAFAQVYVIEGECTDDALAAVKHYVINPVETREACLVARETLQIAHPTPKPVEVIEGFLELDEAGLSQFIEERGLAMDLADIAFFQAYFAGEKRNPTITEVKMIDTYWSDHCRHTTFGTELTNVEIDDKRCSERLERYRKLCATSSAARTSPICLMDMGTIGAKYLKAMAGLDGLDESDEINACTVKCTVDVDGEDQDWLFLFKNETHNHPTEIEPFGGAATCVGGAIRDPLSGRSYVYQAMRVTGAATRRPRLRKRSKGKLPQRKLVTTAAAGYSSYGNQIGLATGQVTSCIIRVMLPSAWRSAPSSTPKATTSSREARSGRQIVLLGGARAVTASAAQPGSSKAQNARRRRELRCRGAEGQRSGRAQDSALFRRGEACRLIKRCNDFGAGGVSLPGRAVRRPAHQPEHGPEESTTASTAPSLQSPRARSAWRAPCRRGCGRNSSAMRRRKP